MNRIASLLVLCVVTTAVCSAQITFEPLPVPANPDAPENPVVNRPVRVKLDSPAETVTVIWRPNSAIPDTVVLPVSGSEFEWTPRRSGVARFEVSGPAGVTSQNVSIRYDKYPAAGIFVLILAAVILFGGAGFAMGKLMGGEMPKSGT
jgi:hypothetical protein